MFAELHVERGRIRAILPCLTGTIIRTETDSFEFPGCYVYPGFVDNHAHIVGLGERRTFVSLHEATNESDCVQRMSTAPIPSNGWVRAMGWNQEHWSSRSMPTRLSLDAAFPNTPVVAMRVDGHAAWVNTAALSAAGLDASEHTGILVDAEMEPLLQAIPAHSPEDITSMILAATSYCASMGITEIHDMDVADVWLEPFRLLAEQGTLPVRVQSFVSAHHDEWQTNGRLPAGGEFHRLAGVKFYADGALGSRGALLRSAYSDDPSTNGFELLSVAEMTRKAREAVDAGWQAIAIHAIGDAAVRNVLDTYEAVRSWEDGSDVILRIEHAQHVHPDDVQRMADLRVFACVQPSHCISDAAMAERRLGADRLSWAYRWRSLLDAGVLIGAGSDFPIESPSVLSGLSAFVDRVPHGMTQSWQGQERIGVTEAIEAYTIGAHTTSGMEYRRGSLKIGYDADMVIVDRNLEECTADELIDTRIMATFTAGKRRYSV
ncbi:MAG: amidohydrolase family protein [Ignavibacteria bacterium]|nr:amidohydrolase family protein [Ignavibacteria bacterium]